MGQRRGRNSRRPRSSGPLNHGTQAVEFAWLVNHGMTPAAALQAATMVDAQMMGWEDRIGSIEKGKYADIGSRFWRPDKGHHRDWNE